MQKHRATVIPELQVVTEPEEIKEAPIFPSCTVTRAMTRKMNNEDLEDLVVNLADTFMSHSHGKDAKESSNHLRSTEDLEADPAILERDKLIEEQMKDPEVARLA